MSDISIVTAFFDIGRGDWTPEKGLPHYLHRTTDTYIERFGHLSKLENDMVVFTSVDLVDKIKPLTNKNTSIITIDFKNSFNELREKIKAVQSDPTFLSKINPREVLNPEYWSPDYVLVNLLKSHFVKLAEPVVENELIAWVDFGYCRTESALNGKTKWQYPFDKNKIHFFNLKEWVEGTYIQDVIANNDVHITGPCIIGGAEVWENLRLLVQHNTNELLKNNLIDDDQTLLLMSYLTKPDMFELHPVSKDDWFIVFKDYNESVS
jgi:protein YibB